MGAKPLALSARGVHVAYRASRTVSLRERFSGTDATVRRVHAVRGVSFNLNVGDVLGIVGHNGSGKSTLLRACAGLLPLMEGEVLAASRPSLLGVGSVLNQRVSGRNNLYTGCMALGMSYDEVTERIPQMVEFSGLGDFIDMPMFTYSTGMRARLNFTIATVKNPEILLLDEVLSGGDRTFKQRALGRIREIQEAAGAIIYVSHNTNEIARLCNRAIWMRRGKIVERGGPKKVLRAYEKAAPALPQLS